MKTLVIPEEKTIDLEALEMACDALPRLLGGGEIKVEHMIVVKTENIRAYQSLLAILAGEEAELPTAASLAAVTGKKLVKSAPAETIRKSIRAWEIEGRPDKITKEEVQEALVKHTFKAGQRLHHPRAGWQVVAKAENPDDPDELVAAGDWNG